MGSQRVGHDWGTNTYTCHHIYLRIHVHSTSPASIDRLLGCFHILAIVNNTMNLGYMYLFELVFLFFFSGIYSEVKLLGHMVVLVLVFKETSMLFSTVTALIYIPTKIVQGFLVYKYKVFFISLPTFVTCRLFFIIAILIGMRSYLSDFDLHFPND